MGRSGTRKQGRGWEARTERGFKRDRRGGPGDPGFEEEEKISVFTEPELDIYTATEHELLREKDRLINLIIEYRKISSRINNAFNSEIQGHITRKKKLLINWCSWLKT